eukprot:GILJ01051976.1.p1 GENE.GILJ01051976.1~~GILJ01051976.1.p1  ORF type:complete len:102 (-),score=14.25 GILJ01051976.1:66-371(-)
MSRVVRTPSDLASTPRAIYSRPTISPSQATNLSDSDSFEEWNSPRVPELATLAKLPARLKDYDDDLPISRDVKANHFYFHHSDPPQHEAEETKVLLKLVWS